MNKIEQIRQRRQEAHRQLLDAKSKVYKAFLDLEAAAFAEGALPKKTKELIAAGISVVGNCESCMEWHITQAARSGASRQEILEAIEVGIEMAGGPATVAARFALEVMDEVFRVTTPKG
jgi:AhpD family alkylhydroperoxidase